MNKIERDNGVVITEQTQIMEEVKTFYKNLYKQDEYIEDIDLEQYENEVNKLTYTESDKLEGILTFSEISSTLYMMKNDKRPGLSGFSAEFFKVFWRQIGHFILRSINYGYEKGNLFITQRQGLITCIPKENKPKQFLQNWRPLTLLDIVIK